MDCGWQPELALIHVLTHIILTKAHNRIIFNAFVAFLGRILSTSITWLCFPTSRCYCVDYLFYLTRSADVLQTQDFYHTRWNGIKFKSSMLMSFSHWHFHEGWPIHLAWSSIRQLVLIKVCTCWSSRWASLHTSSCNMLASQQLNTGELTWIEIIFTWFATYMGQIN